MSTPPARRLPVPSDPLFVYGTLMFPEVLVELLGRAPHLDAARVSGRRAAALPGRVYPGLVTAAGAVTRGAVLRGLTAAEWRMLDDFEDDEYELRPVFVRTGETAHAAWTYVWTAEALASDWSATAFADDHLPYYAGSCARWRHRPAH
ncbi:MULTISPECIES: gamma-glutamylcyclotransferase family protein [unclassified Nocardia]|uniref:gamma-glutamylcyclotransferase family protein n=1 Tax=unclassified Nocardia TaxID=2637762 RepID=UPI0024A805B4|nr:MULTISPECIES: gamma-glutamylcyclotransferase family protein [unclassified Nocardia]